MFKDALQALTAWGRWRLSAGLKGRGFANLWDDVLKIVMFDCATLLLFIMVTCIYCQCQNKPSEQQTQLRAVCCSEGTRGAGLSDFRSIPSARHASTARGSRPCSNCPITREGVATGPSPSRTLAEPLRSRTVWRRRGVNVAPARVFSVTRVGRRSRAVPSVPK